MDLWSAVKSIPTPTLLQYGSHSNVVSRELAARMAETMPRCTVERIEGAGHGLFTDQPEAFAESVERFLAADACLTTEVDRTFSLLVRRRARLAPRVRPVGSSS